MYEHFHKLLVLQEHDMGSSADPGVKIFVLDLKIDV